MAKRKRKPVVEYQALPEAQDICRKLVMQWHGHLADAYVLVVGKPGPSPRPKAAWTKRATPMDKFLLAKAGERADYLIVVMLDQWAAWTPKQKEIVLDHELTHCSGRNERGLWALRDHDVEEFTEILERHGAWTPRLDKFVAAARQLPLDLGAHA